VLQDPQRAVRLLVTVTFPASGTVVVLGVPSRPTWVVFLVFLVFLVSLVVPAVELVGHGKVAVVSK